MKIRAICTDIDGTLLDSQRQLSARTIAAVKSLKGIPFILASSRMPAAMRHLQAELDILDCPLISYNGGYIVHTINATARILESVSIPHDHCADIVAMTKGTSIHVSLYTGDAWYAPARDQWTEREERITRVKAALRDPLHVLDQWKAERTGGHKVMCMGPADEINTLESRLNHALGSALHIYRSRDTYLEIAPRAVSKATAMAIVLREIYHVDMVDAMAFGDNYNDIDMLAAAGFGVAVGNARPEVKAVAREITLNSIDDGVAVAIEKYCL
jgi:Cof subfamily protein (haloacid dehalogenase superfamily)